MPQVTRRTFLKGAAVTATVGAGVSARAADGEAAKDGSVVIAPDEQLEVRLTLNGEARSLKVLPDTTLAEALREGEGLTGTKTSCEGGACGACTVHIGGRPASSCLTLAVDVEGGEVNTIESIATAEGLHPVQQAFVDADALQCGFCTPGFVMAGVAFYNQWTSAHGNAEPPRGEVEKALSGNLCRCGAQPHLIEAVSAACAGRQARQPGGSLPPWGVARKDAVEKVTGAATYTVDRYPEGTLHGALLRSPHAAAKVNAIRTDKAAGMPGVRAVEVLKPKVGAGYGQVRYAGQELVAIAADTLKQAEAACRAVEVDYEVLPHVVDWRDAAKPGAPAVWSDTSAAPSAAEGPGAPEFLMKWDGNVRGPAYWPFHRENGKAKKLAASSAHAAALSAETAVQVHVSLERHAAVASWGTDEDKGQTGPASLTMWISTQAVQGIAGQMAELFDIPSTRVRVIGPYVGGAFGSKAQPRAEHVAAAKLAKAAGRPVRVVASFADHLSAGGNRPGTQHFISAGADENGKIVALSHEARSMCGIAVGERATGLSEVHYPGIDEVNIVDSSVVTHTPPSCPWRAPGYPPNAFALEQVVDELAVKAGKDPLTFRIDQEERRRTRMLYRSALERSGYKDRLAAVGDDSSGRYARGVGVATGEWFALTSPSARVQIKAFKDGHVEVSTATHDMGQGARSVLANVVAERLRLPSSRIEVKIADSDLSTSSGSFGSITTTSIAPPAMKAADELRAILAHKGQRKVPGGRVTPTGLAADDGKITPWADLFETLTEEPTITVAQRGTDNDGYSLPPKIFDPIVGYSPIAIAKDQPASVHIAEVEVDRRLGRVRVLRSFVAVDGGRIVSPVTATSQLVGATMQGISYALYEGVRMDKASGRQLNRNVETYGILGIADAPEVDVHFYDAPSPNNPYGSIGIGENAIVAAAASVANAIYRAGGRRVTTTPMTPARVLAALR
jgi:xanthine dehydrogenase YagR molybdenum-binding subunit